MTPYTIRCCMPIALAGLLLFSLFIAPTPAKAQGEEGGDSTRRAFDGMQVDAPVSPAPSGAGLGKAAGAARIQARVDGNLGATVGGAQDIGYARLLIQQGRVPSSLGFSAEGLYSEHDIPTPSTACDEPLCLSLGYGYAPLADSLSNALLVQLGMASNIRADGFHRRPLRLAVVVDKSGSMSGGKIQAVRAALAKLIAKLNADDRVTIVFFNDRVEQVILMGPGDRTEQMLAKINALGASGGTNIEAGLKLGYEEVSMFPDDPGVLKRVMLLTDMRPNIGRTDSMSFRQLTERYAKVGIGLSAFGVGIDFGYDLVYHISQLRGGNFFYLESPEKIARVFDTEFDYMVTPLLYDLNLKIETPPGLRLTAVYGLPTWKPGDRDANLHIPTVFLSSNRGAIILRYEQENGGDLTIDNGELLATGSLSYSDIDGNPHRETTSLRHTGTDRLAPGSQFYTHEGMRLAAALTNVYFGLRDACRLSAEARKDDALKALARARGLVALENLILNDRDLDKELVLLERLEENILATNPVSAR